MADNQIIEVPISGMDCADCARHVQHAIAELPGVDSVDVLAALKRQVTSHALMTLGVIAALAVGQWATAL